MVELGHACPPAGEFPEGCLHITCVAATLLQMLDHEREANDELRGALERVAEQPAVYIHLNPYQRPPGDPEIHSTWYVRRDVLQAAIGLPLLARIIDEKKK